MRANAPGDPFLMTGFDKKVLHLSHDEGKEARFKVEIDFLGCGAWRTYATLTVDADGCLPHVFPAGFSAHWVRVTALEDCSKARAQFHST